MKTRLPKQAADSLRTDTKREGVGHNISTYSVLAGLMFLLIVAVGCQGEKVPNVGLIGNMGADRVTALDADAIALENDEDIPRNSNAEHYAMAIKRYAWPEGDRSRGRRNSCWSEAVPATALAIISPLSSSSTAAPSAAAISRARSATR